MNSTFNLEQWKADKKAQVEQLNNDVDNYITEIAESIKQIRNATDFITTVENIAKVSQLSKYSYNNQVLIFIQSANKGFSPTVLNGFKQWKKVGRIVKKGQKGMQILAPVIIEKENEETKEIEKKLVGFKVVYVFDYQQTDVLQGFKGTPFELSQLDNSQDIIVSETEQSEFIKTELLTVTKHFGITVSDEPLKNGLYGFANSDKKIVMSTIENKTVNTYNHTLLHEMAHIIAGHVFEKGKRSKVIYELEAELIAGVVGQIIGVPSQDEVSRYLAIYKEFSLDEMKAVAKNVLVATQTILTAFN